MNASPYSNHLPTEWRNALCLYPLYLALAQEFVIELPASPELESGTDAPSQDCVQQARQWFNTMDERIQVHQLRQFLQTTPLADNEIVRLMLLRHLGKEQRTPADRDKIDFLLVQFFSLSTPSRLDDSDCELDYVAEILRPVLGAVETVLSDWLSELEATEVAAAARAFGRSEEPARVAGAAGLAGSEQRARTSSTTVRRSASIFNGCPEEYSAWNITFQE